MTQRPIPTSRRFSPLLTYGVSFATTWGLLPLESHVRHAEIAVALALQLGVGALLSQVHRWDRRRWVGVLGVTVFLASVALLRDGVGVTAGYTSLMLLPVFGAALRSRRFELVWALTGAVLVLFAPIVLVGGSRYPQSGWRTDGLWIVISAGLGVAVIGLVDRLSASNQRHRLWAENSTDVVVRFAPDGTILYASPASRRLLGYQPSELKGRVIVELLHPDDRDRYDERRRRVNATSDTITLEHRLRHRDGRWIWFEATVRSIRDSSGDVIERQGALRQIEERKQLQVIVERQRDDATNLLDEQRGLREIATLVAAGANRDAVYDAVAQQVARLFHGALGAGVVRFDPAAAVGEIVGGWSAGATQVTGLLDLTGATAAASVFQTGAPARVASVADGSSDRFFDGMRLGGAAAAPITIEGSLWGSVGVTIAADRTFPASSQERLASFAELVAVAISSAESLEMLSLQATTDPITGLANYRAFHARLLAEVERSSRHGRPLSVAMLDLDHFKHVNDTHGHQIGDRVLAEVGRRMAREVRGGELMARVGGEEFAWLMFDSAEEGVYAAAERVRVAVDETPFDTAGALTISIGVCSNDSGYTAEELIARADQALYLSKQRGRNRTSVNSLAAHRALLGSSVE